MPLHIAALAVMIGTELLVLAAIASTGNASDVVVSEVVVTACLVLSLGARIVVHRWEDQAKAQRAGAMAWTLTVVLSFAIDCTARPACSNIRTVPSLSLIHI